MDWNLKEEWLCLNRLHHLINGFGIAATVQNLLYCLIGCIVGTIIGVLPGIGPIAGIALLIPATFGLNPTSAIIMLAGIYYGAMYGGSTTSILLNVPGETASVITCIDGYQNGPERKGWPCPCHLCHWLFHCRDDWNIRIGLSGPAIGRGSISLWPS